MANVKKKGDSPRMRKVTIQLEEELVREVKMLAAKELTTIAAIVTRALESEIKKGGKQQ